MEIMEQDSKINKTLQCLCCCALFLLVFFVTNDVWAMSCYRPQDAVKEHSLVFVGEVTSIESKEIKMPETAKKDGFDEETYELWFGNHTKTTFRVIEAIKGPALDEVELFHSSNSVVGRDYVQGRRYIVFTSMNEAGNYTSGACATIIGFEEVNGDYRPHMGKYLVDVRTYQAQRKAYEQLAKDYPDDTQSYLELGKFHESYQDYASAEQAYKEGLLLRYNDWLNEQNTTSKNVTEISDSWWAVIRKNGFSTDSHARTFYHFYGKMLYLQGLYDQAVIPLEFSVRDDAKRMINTALIKQEKYEKLDKDDLDLAWMELTSLDLSGLKLSNVNLAHAKVNNLVLHNTNISDADFTGAKIRSIDIEGSTFRNSNFSEAEISGDIKDTKFLDSTFEKTRFYINKLENIDFDGSDLKDAALTGYQGSEGVSLKNTKLDGTYIQHLTGVDLTGAEIKQLNRGYTTYKVEWQNADLQGADLSYAKLREAQLRGANLEGAKLSSADLRPHGGPSDLRGTNLSEANLDGANLVFAYYDCDTKFPKSFEPMSQLLVPRWENCVQKKPNSDLIIEEAHANLVDDLYEVHFENVDFTGVTFKNFELKYLTCRKCNLKNATFEKVPTRLQLEDSDLRGAVFMDSTMSEHSSFKGSDIRGADLRALKIKENGIRIKTKPKFMNAIYDETTLWPEGFNPEITGATFKER